MSTQRRVYSTHSAILGYAFIVIRVCSPDKKFQNPVFMSLLLAEQVGLYNKVRVIQVLHKHHGVGGKVGDVRFRQFHRYECISVQRISLQGRGGQLSIPKKLCNI